MYQKMNDFKDTWQTGDILLFNNKNSCFGKFIKFFTNSKYSHVGMILRNPSFTEKPLIGLFFWESSNENYDDVEDHKKKLGVEIVDMNELIEKSGTIELYYRKLNLDNKILNEDKLKEIHEIVHNKPYDIVPLDWIEAFFKVDSRPQKTERFWCSALLGYIYVKLDLLPSDTDWSILRPSYFSDENKNLKLIGASFGPEIRIK